MSTYMPDGNLGLAYLASGKSDAALEMLADAHEQAAASGHPKVALVFQLAYDAALLRLSPQPREGLRERVERLASHRVFDHHATWVLDLLAAAARDAGLLELAEFVEQVSKLSDERAGA